MFKAGHIIEVLYPNWIANTIVVPKKGGKWRVCIDYTDLNKSCPKDGFPVPKIDQLVDMTAGNEMLSFMDAYSGYNQIRMHPIDQEKTAFITDRGLYCYGEMPFGLKNVRAMYQWMVNLMFYAQIRDTIESYIDDMLVENRKV